jgi:hypothetical protein
VSFSPRLLLIAAASALLGLIAAWVALPFLADDADQSQSRRMLADVTERAEARHELFDALISKHRAAIDRFRRRFKGLEQAEADTLFDAYFPEHESGARRSRPEDFDGVIRQDGARTFGMGAFIGETAPDARTRRVMVAAYQTVRDTGPAFLDRFNTLYFNDGRNLVIFAPEREDRLIFYRDEAPADFRWDQHEMVDIVLPENNPMGRTACTGLTDLVYTEDARVQSIGCHTPVRLNGTHLGAFGDTLDVNQILLDAVSDTPDSMTAMMITRTGDVVAHPALFGDAVITDADVRRVAEERGFAALGRMVIEQGHRSGVINASDRGSLIAYARLAAPGWILVLESPAPGGSIWTLLKAAAIGALIGAIVFLQFVLVWGGLGPRGPGAR